MEVGEGVAQCPDATYQQQQGDTIPKMVHAMTDCLNRVVRDSLYTAKGRVASSKMLFTASWLPVAWHIEQSPSS